ncbi:MAG: murein transglycosylase A [Pleurocapsa sp.]
MHKAIARLGLGLGIVVLTSGWQTVRALPLKPVPIDKIEHIGIDRQLQANPSCTEKISLYQFPTNSNCPNTPQDNPQAQDWNQSNRASLVKAIDDSLYYLSTPKAAEAYRKYSPDDFTLDRVRRSLLRFKELLLTTNSPEELATAVKTEFIFYQSVGKDNQGNVEFTGYFEPTYSASLVATPEYRYPLYRKPSNFDRWAKPHPTRAQLEGTDGLSGNKSVLSGYELVWLRDRLEAFLVQVQGSAKLNLTNGSTMTVGYGGTTDYDYTSIGGELVKDGIFTKEELSLPKLLDYFQAHPQELDKYIPRNNRFVFFRETNGAKPTGSLGVPVTGDRSIATDKSLMPPGALALIVAPIPDVEANGDITTQVVSRYVLDHDTGSAIKGAGRVDIFLGTGTVAGERAGRINGSGNLFYLLLKP